mmetsp:Transcript_19276/g.60595  ORF Transcript_19276/g.60595 Transcript_19276/m.60595 type:complete len:228 (+) Transcript_19276:53-736(+)
MACVSRRAIVSNSLISAARRRVRERKTARLISATSAFSTASTRVSWVRAACLCSSVEVSSLPKGEILVGFTSDAWLLSDASFKDSWPTTEKRRDLPPPASELETRCRRLEDLWGRPLLKVMSGSSSKQESPKEPRAKQQRRAAASLMAAAEAIAKRFRLGLFALGGGVDSRQPERSSMCCARVTSSEQSLSSLDPPRRLRLASRPPLNTGLSAGGYTGGRVLAAAPC